MGDGWEVKQLAGARKGLAHLTCGDNKLTELNLSNVPKLAELDCFRNQLAELDLRTFRLSPSCIAVRTNLSNSTSQISRS